MRRPAVSIRTVPLPPAAGPFTHPSGFTSHAPPDVTQKRVAAADPADATFAGYRSTMATRFGRR